MAHLAWNPTDIIVVVPKANMNWHMKAVGNGLGIVYPRGVLEVEIVISGRIVVKIIANDEDLLNGGVKRVDEVARGGEARCGDEDALVILVAILAALDIKVVDDM